MNLEKIEKQLYSDKFLDEKNNYIYASLSNKIGGLIGSVKGLVLLSVYEDILYIHRANIDNSYGKQLAKIYIPNMKISKEKPDYLVESFLSSMKDKNINLNCHQRPENLWIFL